MANPFRRAGLFIGETVEELQKSVWPTKSELKDSTLVVFFASLLLGLFISLADFSVYGWVSLLTQIVR